MMKIVKDSPCSFHRSLFFLRYGNYLSSCVGIRLSRVGPAFIFAVLCLIKSWYGTGFLSGPFFNRIRQTCPSPFIIMREDDPSFEKNDHNKFLFFKRYTYSFSQLPAEAGFLFKNKYSVESQYHINKVMLDNTEWKTRFVNSFNILFGYRLK